jgi:hypothetical protein
MIKAFGTYDQLKRSAVDIEAFIPHSDDVEEEQVRICIYTIYVYVYVLVCIVGLCI